MNIVQVEFLRGRRDGISNFMLNERPLITNDAIVTESIGNFA